MKKKLLLSLTSLFLLAGCVSGVTATADDAYEVALDDSNVTETEVLEHNVEEGKSKYTVQFSTASGSYEYIIGKDGLIQDKSYTKEVIELEEETEEETKEEKKEEETELSDSEKQQALEAACTNMGISTSDVSGESVTLEDGDIVVRIPTDSGTSVTIVDRDSMTATSSYSE